MAHSRNDSTLNKLIKSANSVKDLQVFLNYFNHDCKINLDSNLIEHFQRLLNNVLTPAVADVEHYEGISCILICLESQSKDINDEQCWDKLHLEFTHLLDNCLRYITIFLDDKMNMFLPLWSLLCNIIFTTSSKYTCIKNTMVKILSPSLITITCDFKITVKLQQEFFKTIISILAHSDRELRKSVLMNSETQMSRLLNLLPKCGDYDTQVSIVEVSLRYLSQRGDRSLLCRLLNADSFITHLYKDIRFNEFDTDCRKFLNAFNSSLGNNATVITIPCITVFLEKQQLTKPKDDKYEKFWIDFNLGSNTINVICDRQSVAGREVVDGDSDSWEIISINTLMVNKVTLENRLNTEGSADCKELNLTLTRSCNFLYDSSLQCVQNAKNICILFSCSPLLETIENTILPKMFKYWCRNDTVNDSTTVCKNTFQEPTAQPPITPSCRKRKASESICKISTRKQFTPLECVVNRSQRSQTAQAGEVNKQDDEHSKPENQTKFKKASQGTVSIRSSLSSLQSSGPGMEFQERLQNHCPTWFMKKDKENVKPVLSCVSEEPSQLSQSQQPQKINQQLPRKLQIKASIARGVNCGEHLNSQSKLKSDFDSLSNSKSTSQRNNHVSYAPNTKSVTDDVLGSCKKVKLFKTTENEKSKENETSYESVSAVQENSISLTQKNQPKTLSTAILISDTLGSKKQMSQKSQNDISKETKDIPDKNALSIIVKDKKDASNTDSLTSLENVSIINKDDVALQKPCQHVPDVEHIAQDRDHSIVSTNNDKTKERDISNNEKVTKSVDGSRKKLDNRYLEQKSRKTPTNTKITVLYDSPKANVSTNNHHPSNSPEILESRTNSTTETKLVDHSDHSKEPMATENEKLVNLPGKFKQLTRKRNPCNKKSMSVVEKGHQATNKEQIETSQKLETNTRCTRSRSKVSKADDDKKDRITDKENIVPYSENLKTTSSHKKWVKITKQTVSTDTNITQATEDKVNNKLKTIAKDRDIAMVTIPLDDIKEKMVADRNHAVCPSEKLDTAAKNIEHANVIKSVNNQSEKVATDKGAVHATVTIPDDNIKDRVNVVTHSEKSETMPKDTDCIKDTNHACSLSKDIVTGEEDMINSRKTLDTMARDRKHLKVAIPVKDDQKKKMDRAREQVLNSSEKSESVKNDIEHVTGANFVGDSSQKIGTEEDVMVNSARKLVTLAKDIEHHSKVSKAVDDTVEEIAIGRENMSTISEKLSSMTTGTVDTNVIKEMDGHSKKISLENGHITRAKEKLANKKKDRKQKQKSNLLAVIQADWESSDECPKMPEKIGNAKTKQNDPLQSRKQADILFNDIEILRCSPVMESSNLRPQLRSKLDQENEIVSSSSKPKKANNYSQKIETCSKFFKSRGRQSKQQVEKKDTAKNACIPVENETSESANSFGKCKGKASNVQVHSTRNCETVVQNNEAINVTNINTSIEKNSSVENVDDLSFQHLPNTIELNRDRNKELNGLRNISTSCAIAVSAESSPLLQRHTSKESELKELPSKTPEKMGSIQKMSLDVHSSSTGDVSTSVSKRKLFTLTSDVRMIKMTNYEENIVSSSHKKTRKMTTTRIHEETSFVNDDDSSIELCSPYFNSSKTVEKRNDSITESEMYESLPKPHNQSKTRKKNRWALRLENEKRNCKEKMKRKKNTSRISLLTDIGTADESDWLSPLRGRNMNRKSLIQIENDTNKVTKKNNFVSRCENVDDSVEILRSHQRKKRSSNKTHRKLVKSVNETYFPVSNLRSPEEEEEYPDLIVEVIPKRGMNPRIQSSATKEIMNVLPLSIEPAVESTGLNQFVKKVHAEVSKDNTFPHPCSVRCSQPCQVHITNEHLSSSPRENPIQKEQILPDKSFHTVEVLDFFKEFDNLSENSTPTPINTDKQAISKASANALVDKEVINDAVTSSKHTDVGNCRKSIGDKLSALISCNTEPEGGEYNCTSSSPVHDEDKLLYFQEGSNQTINSATKINKSNCDIHESSEEAEEACKVNKKKIGTNSANPYSNSAIIEHVTVSRQNNHIALDKVIIAENESELRFDKSNEPLDERMLITPNILDLTLSSLSSVSESLVDKDEDNSNTMFGVGKGTNQNGDRGKIRVLKSTRDCLSDEENVSIEQLAKTRESKEVNHNTELGEVTEKQRNQKTVTKKGNNDKRKELKINEAKKKKYQFQSSEVDLHSELSDISTNSEFHFNDENKENLNGLSCSLDKKKASQKRSAKKGDVKRGNKAITMKSTTPVSKLTHSIEEPTLHSLSGEVNMSGVTYFTKRNHKRTTKQQRITQPNKTTKIKNPYFKRSYSSSISSHSSLSDNVDVTNEQVVKLQGNKSKINLVHVNAKQTRRKDRDKQCLAKPSEMEKLKYLVPTTTSVSQSILQLSELSSSSELHLDDEGNTNFKSSGNNCKNKSRLIKGKQKCKGDGDKRKINKVDQLIKRNKPKKNTEVIHSFSELSDLSSDIELLSDDENLEIENEEGMSNPIPGLVQLKQTIHKGMSIEGERSKIHSPKIHTKIRNISKQPKQSDLVASNGIPDVSSCSEPFSSTDECTSKQMVMMQECKTEKSFVTSASVTNKTNLIAQRAKYSSHEDYSDEDYSVDSPGSSLRSNYNSSLMPIDQSLKQLSKKKLQYLHNFSKDVLQMYDDLSTTFINGQTVREKSKEQLFGSIASEITFLENKQKEIKQCEERFEEMLRIIKQKNSCYSEVQESLSRVQQLYNSYENDITKADKEQEMKFTTIKAHLHNLLQEEMMKEKKKIVARCQAISMLLYSQSE